MKILILFILISYSSLANLTISGKVTNSENEQIAGATIKLLSLNGKILNGVIVKNDGTFLFGSIKTGFYTLNVKSIGYKEISDTINLLADFNKDYILESIINEEEELVVSATRSFRAIEDVPIRVELIPASELDESITMGLGSAKAVLGELPGVMGQVNSASSGASGVRLRGLDSRYTQILVDGVPAFGGLNMNFSVLTLPPLNLKQLEIIKGSASGLQSDAIGGIINFITRKPLSDKTELTAVLNYTTQNAKNVAIWVGQKFNDLDISIHSTYNSIPKVYLNSRKYEDNFIDVQEQSTLHINNKIAYAFSKFTDISLSTNILLDSRIGGDNRASLDFNNPSLVYFTNGLKTKRYDIIASFKSQINEKNLLLINSSFINTNRKSFFGIYNFNGKENIIYTDVNWSTNLNPLTINLGASSLFDNFEESSKDSIYGQRLFDYSTISFHSQFEYKFSNDIIAIILLKFDSHNKYGSVLIPRFSTLFKINNELSVRFALGKGWRAPNIFDEYAESRGYRFVPNITTFNKENSFSTNLDIKYKSVINDLIITTNFNIFYTSISNKIGLVLDSNSNLLNWELNPNLNSFGGELIFQAELNHFNLIFGYTYSKVTDEIKGIQVDKLLTPNHFINAAVLWEIPETIRIVSDFMLQSPQILSQNIYLSKSPTVATWGGSLEYWLNKNISIFINVENALDYKQTNYMPLYLGIPGQNSFNNNIVWGPVEGRVANIGMKIKI
ncbi:MAG: TonB-dependent receptor [Candidatus Kapabacteria bacterium]|nr:TonB-dependent receptor [Candidatus Kapabacteria bacterium]